MIKLNESAQYLKGVGPNFAKKLNRMGIKTVHDLLCHSPRRYEDFSNIKKIKEIALNKENRVCGQITQINFSKSPRKKIPVTEALIKDKAGAIRAVWFGSPFIKNALNTGDFVCLAGKGKMDKNGLYLSVSVFEKISPNEKLEDFGKIISIYPETEGLSSRWLCKIIWTALEEAKNDIEESLPEEIIEKYNFPRKKEALWNIHFPDNLKTAEKSRERFVFENLFIVGILTLQRKMKMKREKAPSIEIDAETIKKFVSSLPFSLTEGQKKNAWRILKDTEKPYPMARLLQGDVGSGKTLVALIAALNAARAGYQTAFMAPTEILAKQHFAEAARRLQKFKIRIALLTGKQDQIISQKLPGELIEISRKKILEKLKGKTNKATGQKEVGIDVLVGTHTLIQEKVKFGKLGLCVVDEQHRFGVEQRAKVAEGTEKIPHLLSMTATPIPRSLALTIYGDLSLSLLREMPPGRKEVKTEVVPPEEKERKRVYDFIKKRIKKGEQVFVICPRIEPKENESASEARRPLKAVEEEFKKLSQDIMPEFRVEKIYGKMLSKEKEKIMKRFRDGKIDILVSTSVVEVGVDIPGATIMLIEGAERFGLSQLHQFRGRVGRRGKQSFCFIFTESNSKTTRQRMKAIEKNKNGFDLAEKDLKIRGPGSFLGVKQSGLPDLAMENLKNLDLVEKAREEAKNILLKDPLLGRHKGVKKEAQNLKKRFYLE